MLTGECEAIDWRCDEGMREAFLLVRIYGLRRYVLRVFC
jgi:hypothetical protein